MGITFNCTQCGACCKMVTKELGALYNLPVNESGMGCAHLNEDNTCSIYDKRPKICRVDEMYYERNRELNITKKEYFKMTENICKDLEAKVKQWENTSNESEKNTSGSETTDES